MEIWKDVVGYEGLYEVSSLGQVRSKKTKLIKKQRLMNRGYPAVTLKRMELVHRLIAKAFVENPYNKEQVNHINGIKTDNSLDNLEWVTHAENQRHAFKIGLKKANELFGTGKQAGENNFGNKYSKDLIIKVKEMFKNGKKVKEVNILTGISISHLYSIKSGHKWGHVEI